MRIILNVPAIIKIPFMRMMLEWPDATCACLNFGETFAPAEVLDKSICVNDDIGNTLKAL